MYTNAALDRKINNLENTLSDYAAYPIILPGIAKIAFGSAQALSALSSGIILSIPSAVTRDFSHVDYCWSHIKHGLGNIFAGTFESIPLVSSVVFVIRYSGRNHATIQPPVVYTCHEDKWMPYNSLEDLDWEIYSADDSITKDACAAFQEYLGTLDNHENFTNRQKLELAREFIRNNKFY